MTVKTAHRLLRRPRSNNAELAFLAMALDVDLEKAKLLKEFKRIVKKVGGLEWVEQKRLLRDNALMAAHQKYWYAVKPHTKAKWMKAVIQRFKELCP